MSADTWPTDHPSGDLPIEPIPPADPPTADQTASGTNPKTDQDAKLAGTLDDIETRLNQTEQLVADLLVETIHDLPTTPDQINLSLTGETPNTTNPVTAAVDLTHTGGFDANGTWHDSFGKFAKKGWSGLKHAALQAIFGDTTRHHINTHGPTRLHIRDHTLARHLGHPDGWALARYGDHNHAIIDNNRGIPVYVPWTAFDEPAPPRITPATQHGHHTRIPGLPRTPDTNNLPNLPNTRNTGPNTVDTNPATQLANNINQTDPTANAQPADIPLTNATPHLAPQEARDAATTRQHLTHIESGYATPDTPDSGWTGDLIRTAATTRNAGFDQNIADGTPTIDIAHNNEAAYRQAGVIAPNGAWYPASVVDTPTPIPDGANPDDWSLSYGRQVAGLDVTVRVRKVGDTTGELHPATALAGNPDRVDSPARSVPPQIDDKGRYPTGPIDPARVVWDTQPGDLPDETFVRTRIVGQFVGTDDTDHPLNTVDVNIVGDDSGWFWMVDAANPQDGIGPIDDWVDPEQPVPWYEDGHTRNLDDAKTAALEAAARMSVLETFPPVDMVHTVDGPGVLLADREGRRPRPKPQTFNQRMLGATVEWTDWDTSPPTDGPDTNNLGQTAPWDRDKDAKPPWTVPYQFPKERTTVGNVTFVPYRRDANGDPAAPAAPDSNDMAGRLPDGVKLTKLAFDEERDAYDPEKVTKWEVTVDGRPAGRLIRTATMQGDPYRGSFANVVEWKAWNGEPGRGNSYTWDSYADTKPREQALEWLASQARAKANRPDTNDLPDATEFDAWKAEEVARENRVYDPASIIERARVANADYPDAIAAIDGGTPVVRVDAVAEGPLGKDIRIIRTAGIETVDGDFVAADQPVVYTTRASWRSDKLRNMGAWWGRKAAGPGVPVSVKTNFDTERSRFEPTITVMPDGADAPPLDRSGTVTGLDDFAARFQGKLTDADIAAHPELVGVAERALDLFGGDSRSSFVEDLHNRQMAGGRLSPKQARGALNALRRDIDRHVRGKAALESAIGIPPAKKAIDVGDVVQRIGDSRSGGRVVGLNPVGLDGTATVEMPDGRRYESAFSELEYAVDSNDMADGAAQALANRLLTGPLADPQHFRDTKANLAAMPTRDLISAYDTLDVPDPSASIDDAIVAVQNELYGRGIEVGFDNDGVVAWRRDDDTETPLTADELDVFDGPDSNDMAAPDRMFTPGEPVMMANGKMSTPFPKPAKRGELTVKRVDQWLIENATAVMHDRGDNYARTIAEGWADEKPGKLPPATRDELNYTIFGWDSNDLVDRPDRVADEPRLIDADTFIGPVSVLIPAGMTGPVDVADVMEPTPNTFTNAKVQKYEVPAGIDWAADELPDGTIPRLGADRIAKRWTFTGPGDGIVVRYSGGYNSDPTAYEKVGASYGSIKIAPLDPANSGVTRGVDFGRLDIYPERPRRNGNMTYGRTQDRTPIGTVVVHAHPGTSKVSGTLFSGQTDKTGNYLTVESPEFDTDDELARWAAEQIGPVVLAYQRIDRPSGVNAAILDTPAPNGAVVIRGTIAQPFFDAGSVRDAIVAVSSDKYPGRGYFSRPNHGTAGYTTGGAYGTSTKVLVLTPETSARWRRAYEGTIADMEEWKARKKAQTEARRAARAAKQEKLPDTNDLVDMPPADRVKAAPGRRAWLVAKDSYLSRLGVREGQAVEVAWADTNGGTIDVYDGDTVSAKPVKWDRFADTAPAGAPKVEYPEAGGNPAVAAKGTAARTVAQRVQAAGTNGAPVEVADNYLARYGAPKGSVLTVAYLDDRNAVFNVDGRQVKAGWARFTRRVPEPDGNGGWNLTEPSVDPTPDTPDSNDMAERVDRTILDQIGRMNVLAISGGRSEPIVADGEVIGTRLPVGAGYRVDVVYNRAGDDYTVSRVFSRNGIDYPKGTIAGVYADEVGEIAYQASSFRSYPFGEPDTADLPDRPRLADLSPAEAGTVARATTVFAEAGWRPTDTIGGFRSPDGSILVSRRRTSQGRMYWHAMNVRQGLFYDGAVGLQTGSPEGVLDWADKNAKWTAVVPVDTAPLIDDHKLAQYAADPGIVIYPATGISAGQGKGEFGIIARSSDWQEVGDFAYTYPERVSEAIGRWSTPGEAQGAYEDLRRRLSTLGATGDGDGLLDRAAATAPTLAWSHDVKATAVKPGDWVAHTQGADLPDGGFRVATVTPNDDGTITLDGPDGVTATVRADATTAIHRPTPRLTTIDAPTANDTLSNQALAAMTPDQLAAVRQVAAERRDATPAGSPANTQAAEQIAQIDALTADRNEMAARPWRDWNVEMTTATGGRVVDTVKARSNHEALQRANRLNGHYSGGRWYAIAAEPAPGQPAVPEIPEGTDRGVTLSRVAGQLDAASEAAANDRNPVPALVEAARLLRSDPDLNGGDLHEQVNRVIQGGGGQHLRRLANVARAEADLADGINVDGPDTNDMVSSAKLARLNATNDLLANARQVRGWDENQPGTDGSWATASGWDRVEVSPVVVPDGTTVYTVTVNGHSTDIPDGPFNNVRDAVAERLTLQANNPATGPFDTPDSNDMAGYRDLPDGAISAITQGRDVGTYNVFRKGQEADVVVGFTDEMRQWYNEFYRGRRDPLPLTGDGTLPTGPPSQRADAPTMRVANPAYPSIEQGLTDGPRGKTTEYRVKVNGATVFASTRKPEAMKRHEAEAAKAAAAGVPAVIDRPYDEATGEWLDGPDSNDMADRRVPDRQVDYAMSLIQRGAWRDSDIGQGSDPPSRAELEAMSTAEVSAIIDDLATGFSRNDMVADRPVALSIDRPTVTVDGKQTRDTSIRLDSDGTPPRSGASPIPDGAVRLYHWPSEDPDLNGTLAEGVDTRWAQTYPPVADVVPYVEFYAWPDEITGDAGHGHVAVNGPLPAGRIVSYSTPTIDQLRTLRDNPRFWTVNRLLSMLDRFPAGSPERAAFQARLAELGGRSPADGLDSNGFRPFDVVFRDRTPDVESLVALAGTGVPNGDGRVPTADEIRAMSPSELRALDRAMGRWLAAHPYGEHEGADLLGVAAIAAGLDMVDITIDDPDANKDADDIIDIELLP